MCEKHGKVLASWILAKSLVKMQISMYFSVSPTAVVSRIKLPSDGCMDGHLNTQAIRISVSLGSQAQQSCANNVLKYPSRLFCYALVIFQADSTST